MNASCPVCGGGTFEPRPFPPGAGKNCQLLRCDRCTLEFLYPQPTWEEIQRIYSSDYYKAWGMSQGETTEVARMKKATFGLRLDEVGKRSPSGRLLDVGTASGFLLEVARERGYDVFGVELSHYAASLARAKFGEERIHLGTLQTATFPPNSFDVITMCDLIEHVMSPVETLKLAANLLKPNGTLLIMTPDTGSPTHMLMQQRWTHYKLEHLFYFNLRAMNAAAAAAGLQVVGWRRAKKQLGMQYVKDQLTVYPHWLLTPTVRALCTVVPSFARASLRVTIGEMSVLLSKNGSADGWTPA